MKIKIKSDDFKLSLWIPFSTFILSKILKKYINEDNDGIKISNEDIKQLSKEIKRYVRKYGHFDLVDVVSDDAVVKIRV